MEKYPDSKLALEVVRLRQEIHGLEVKNNRLRKKLKELEDANWKLTYALAEAREGRGRV